MYKHSEIKNYLTLFYDHEPLLNLSFYSEDTFVFYSEHSLSAEIHCHSTTFLIKRNDLFKDLPTLFLNHCRQIRFTKVGV